MRWALGLSYSGTNYVGWQSQSTGQTVQDVLERAIGQFVDHPSGAPPIRTLCAGRTDSGVHGLMQVVHFDTQVARVTASWVRGVNAHLPNDVSVQWAQQVPSDFHARASATSRRYAYVLLESAVRPSIEAKRVGWVMYPLDLTAMQTAASYLVGEHDFSSFRASSCQALSPVKHMLGIDIQSKGAGAMQRYWRFEFEANAFLHHMIRNIMGCFIAVGQGDQPAHWLQAVLAARDRKIAAPTFSPDGLYFLGPCYDKKWGLPERVVAYDWLP